MRQRGGGSVSYTNLLGETVTVKVRGKHYVQPRGYAGNPGRGPAGETCGSCKHITGASSNGNRSFPKCLLARYKWTGGRGSDILVRSPSCEKWEKAE